MPEYLSPGVYVEEIDAGPKPIEGVSTSTAGAVGVTAFGPTTGKPELVTSFAEFVRKFGGFLVEPDPAIVNSWALNATEGGRWWQFPLAVRGFFDNGGQRLYVKRVFSGTATTAGVTLGQGVISEIIQDAPATATQLRLRHLIGLQTGVGVIRIFVNGFAIGTFDVTAYSGTGTITLGAPVGQEVKGGRDFVEIVARTAVQAGDPEVRVNAKASGDWGGSGVSGNGLRVRMRPMVGASLKLMADPVFGGNPASTIVTADATGGATGLQIASVIGLSNGDTVLIDGAPYEISNLTQATITITPAVPNGETWDVGTVVERTGGNPFQTTVAAIANQTDVLITLATVGNLAVNDVVTVNGNQYQVNTVTPPAFAVTPAVPAGETWEVGTSVRRMRPANDPNNAGPTINVKNASQLYESALVELDNGEEKEVFTVLSINGDVVTLSGNATNAYFEDNRLRVIEAEVNVQYRRDFAVEADERFTNLRLINDHSLSYFVTHVNTLSSLVDIEADAGLSIDTLDEFPSVGPAAAATDPELHWADLAGGADNLNGLSVNDFVGVDGGSGARTGIESLQDIDEISICLAPGMWSSTIHSALIQHCESLKDRFAILDSQDDLSIEEIREVREVIDTKYAAIYYPWIEVRNPSVKRNEEIAPSGHLAGIYARVNVERGVHKAPANEVIRGITKIAQDVSKREQDMLNPKGINALRLFPGRGNRVWGARTLSSDSSWKYINVRRLFLFVEESIDEGTQWVVFEPNDEPLWARVRQTVSNFLTTVWRSGALQGTKADEAFFVRCDRSTMTQDDIDNGRLIVLVGIAPVKPAEFVIFRIQQKTFDQKAG